jgi:hypothetical protein
VGLGDSLLLSVTSSDDSLVAAGVLCVSFLSSSSNLACLKSNSGVPVSSVDVLSVSIIFGDLNPGVSVPSDSVAWLVGSVVVEDTSHGGLTSSGNLQTSDTSSNAVPGPQVKW